MSVTLPSADNILFGSRRQAPFDLTGITQFPGTSGTDFLAGNGEGSIFAGTAGIDYFDGQGASDWVDYGARTAQVVVDLTFEGGSQDFQYEIDGTIPVTLRGAAIKDGTGSSDFFVAGSVGSSIENVRLGRASDKFTGDEDDNIALGGRGNDTLNGGDGDDHLRGQEGHDRLFGEGDQDTLDGGGGNDSLDGGLDDDELIGDSGNDTLLGDNGEDEIRAGSGNDRIDGGEGNDIAYLGTGFDTVQMTRGEDGNSTGFNAYFSDDDNQRDTFVVRDLEGGTAGVDFGDRDDFIIGFETGVDKIDLPSGAIFSLFFELTTDISFLPGFVQTFLNPFDDPGIENTVVGVDRDDDGLDGEDYYIIAYDATLGSFDFI